MESDIETLKDNLEQKELALQESMIIVPERPNLNASSDLSFDLEGGKMDDDVWERVNSATNNPQIEAFSRRLQR